LAVVVSGFDLTLSTIFLGFSFSDSFFASGYAVRFYAKNNCENGTCTRVKMKSVQRKKGTRQ